MRHKEYFKVTVEAVTRNPLWLSLEDHDFSTIQGNIIKEANKLSKACPGLKVTVEVRVEMVKNFKSAG